MKKLMLATALMAASGLASAQGYAGALLGLSKLSANCVVDCDTQDTSFKLYGGYEFRPNISVEVGYTNFGKFTNVASYLEIKADAIYAAAVYRLALGSSFSAVGRLGLASVENRWTGGSKSKIKPYGGVSLDYDLDKDIKLTGAVDTTLAEINGDNGAIYLFGLGVQVGF